MKKEKLTRRDALKILTAAGISAVTGKFLRAAGASAGQSGGGDKPNVLIVLFDSLTARNMSLHGYARKTTPHIVKFAERSTVFHRNYPAASFTQASVASLLTGVYPWAHRSLHYNTPLLGLYEKENLFSALSPAYKTITYTHNSYVANILHQFKNDIDLLKPVGDLGFYNANQLGASFDNDYGMGYFATQQRYSAPFNNYSLFFGIVRKIRLIIDALKFSEDYGARYPLGLCSNQDGVLFNLEDAIDWIAEIAKETAPPFFGYFHLFPPHEFYTPRADFADMFAGDSFEPAPKPRHYFSKKLSDAQLAQLRQRYDEYTAFVDSEFGRLVSMLEESGRLDDTYVILTSDHGQMFERGIHGHVEPVLYEPGIHVPLVVHAPGQTARVDVHSPTSNVDLLPSILYWTKQQPRVEYEGKPLPTLGGEEDPGRVVFSGYTRENPKMKPFTKVTLSATRMPYKLIVYRGYDDLPDNDELFNLENDPEELRNLIKEKPEIAAQLREELERNQAQAEKKSLQG